MEKFLAGIAIGYLMGVLTIIGLLLTLAN